MAIITDYSTKETIIKIRFPTETVESVLACLKYPNNIDDLSLEQAKTFFAVIIREFLKGIIYLEELTEIANCLAVYFKKNKSIDKVDGYSLEDVALDASEMSISARKVADSDTRNTAEWHLVHFMEYLRLNRHLFNNLLDEEYKVASYFENRYNANYNEFLKNYSLSSIS